MAKEGHLLLTTWHCPVQCVTFVTNSTQTNVRIHSYKVFDTNECMYRYLRFLNSFATRSTAKEAGPKRKEKAGEEWREKWPKYSGTLRGWSGWSGGRAGSKGAAPSPSGMPEGVDGDVAVVAF